ncbi:iron complex transport system substrate-binding protein [Paucimonas lemoignei]|uniref:Iron complex transport system substrate-binding protein n=1 Tax=Paucimonas lemoignei TaxID=29443 RepID=A0A4R3HPX8_PAULE|nr:ABC transporter substrate-binding protein [Paucimonas lemoignei]TCS33995.1 iron complex transport system substrate-binding protein [Paucimonas lemoignei]
MKKLAIVFFLSMLAYLPPGLAEPVRRVVSLDLCTDWMLTTHGKRAEIAALSPLSRQYPAPWQDGGWPIHDGSLEQILQLKPDLVITGEYNALLLRSRLQALGVRVEILPLPKSLDQIVTYEKRLLDLLGLPAARASVPIAATGTPVRRKRLLLLGPNGIGTGRNSFENDILERAGWSNYLPEEGQIRLDLETIVLDPPEAILWTGSEGNALANQFAQHPVLKHAVPPERWLTTEYWRWQCPGPWTWDLIRQLNAWLN